MMLRTIMMITTLAKSPVPGWNFMILVSGQYTDGKFSVLMSTKSSSCITSFAVNHVKYSRFIRWQNCCLNFCTNCHLCVSQSPVLSSETSNKLCRVWKWPRGNCCQSLGSLLTDVKGLECRLQFALTPYASLLRWVHDYQSFWIGVAS